MANSKLRTAAWMVVAAAMTLASISGPARAASDADQAEALIREGVRLRGQDQTAKALPLFEKAYQISRTPRTAAQLGLCELELQHYAEAEQHLTEALASPDHPWIARNRPALTRSLETASANVGELVLKLSPPDADVSLNGKLLERALVDAPIRLNKGTVDVAVRAPGYQWAHDTVTIAGGKREQRRFALVPEAAPRSAVAAAAPGTRGLPPAAADSTTAPVNPAGEPGADLGPSPARSQPARIAAWVTAGAAVGALALGTAEAFNAASKRDAFNAHTGTASGISYPDCGTANLSSGCKPLKDAYDRALTLSIVGFAAAGALAITSSILFVYSSSGHAGNPEATTGHALACVPDVANRGFGCALRF